jgi:DNA repair protein RadC
MAACQSTTAPARRNRKRKHFMPVLPQAAPPLPGGSVSLFVKEGDNYCKASESTVIRCARQITRTRLRPGIPILDDAELLRDFLTLRLGPRSREVFAVLLLDVHHNLIEYVELFEGTLDGAAVYPREVVQLVLRKRACAVTFVHNHPSGHSDPSWADRLLTRRLKEALALIEVKVIDHLIVGGESVTSMAARGML